MSDKGFTLTEIVMVLVVAAFAGLIIVPKLVNSLSAWDLETETKKLRARIREVQQSAITSQLTYRLTFDLAAESYDIEYDSGSGSYVLVETVELKNNIGIDSTTFTASTNNVVDFDHFGAPSEAGSIVLSDPRGNTSTISIASATGRVKIQ